MLCVEGLTKAFAGRRVLDGLDLAIEPGESVALLGPNGSGKTTTLRCLVGLARYERGRIAIAGIDAARDPVGARARVSYLPQKAVFPATLSVRETLDVIARLRRLGGEPVHREIESCGLTSLADRNVGQLSGGERQRLALAVAFLPAVDLYLFDEPSASLDPAASRVLFRRARQLKREGRTLLFTTHVPTDVRQLASRVVFLRDGRIESDAAGAFELRRWERTLEREIWGGDHDDQDHDDHERAGLADGGVLVADRLRPVTAVAGAGAARSR